MAEVDTDHLHQHDETDAYQYNLYSYNDTMTTLMSILDHDDHDDHHEDNHSNVSHHDDHTHMHDDHHDHADEDHTVELVVLCILTFLTITTNSLVLLAFKRERRLRIYSNLYVISLAISDWCVGALNMPFNIADGVREHSLGIGYVPCHVINGFRYTFVGASVFAIALICFDRHQATFNAVNYFNSRKEKIAYRRIFFAWLLSACIWFPFITVWGIIDQGKSFHENECFPLYGTNVYTSVAAIALLFWIPFPIIAATYGRIYFRIRKKLSSTSRSKTLRHRSVYGKGESSNTDHKDSGIADVKPSAMSADKIDLTDNQTSRNESGIVNMSPLPSYGSQGTLQDKEKRPHVGSLNNEQDSGDLERNSETQKDNANAIKSNVDDPSPNAEGQNVLRKIHNDHSDPTKPSNENPDATMSCTNMTEQHPSQSELKAVINSAPIRTTYSQNFAGQLQKTQQDVKQEQSRRRSKKHQQRDKRGDKATLTLSLVVVSYCICWLPFGIIILIYSLIENDVISHFLKVDEHTAIIVRWWGLCQSLLNPLCYAAAQPLVRRTIWSLLTCATWRRKENSSLFSMSQNQS